MTKGLDNKFLLLHEDGSLTVTNFLGAGIVEAYDQGVLSVVDMKTGQYLESIPRAGFKWDSLEVENNFKNMDENK